MLIPENLCDIEVARQLYGCDVCEGMGLVVTVASVVEPFLTPKQRENVSQVGANVICIVHLDFSLFLIRLS